jgi:L-lactate dehydrogenase (cytochrome)
MKTRMVRPATALDYRQVAQARLPRFLFDYVDGAANEERTMAANHADFSHWNLKQRVLRDVSGVDTSVTVAGEAFSMPVALAPVGMAGMMARRGETQAVRAAHRAGVQFTLSTVGICPIEEVHAAAGKPWWFQLYMIRDRSLIERLLQRALDAGCRTLVFTVDLPVPGVRHRDMHNGMLGNTAAAKRAKFLQLISRPRWLFDVGLRGKPHDFGNLREVLADSKNLDLYKAFIKAEFDPSVTWKDITWLRERWPGKILIKGVMAADDAREAAAVGADGIIVSNHGGRQLDSVSSTIARLPEVVAAVGDQVEVLMDGGIRNGIDVIKALALGARGVLIGRPWVWALAAGGEQGVVDLLETMHKEMASAMAMMGVRRVSELNPDLLERSGEK